MTSPSITIASGRHFLTDRIREEVDWYATPQSRGEPPPPVQKPVPGGAAIVPLAPPDAWQIPSCDLAAAIARRESRRSFVHDPLGIDELAFLLWSTQGVRARLHEAAVLRTVPSAGCRHPFETYLAVLNVATLDPGIYRYLPLDHALVLEQAPDHLPARLAAAARGQRFAAQAAVTFIWTAIPARTEWRYAEASCKVIALDAGHVCQNLYLTAQTVGAGACAIGAYDDDALNAELGLDGESMFVAYAASLGKRMPRE